MPDTYKVDIDASLMRFDPNHHKFLDRIRKEIPAFAKFKDKNFTSDPAKRRLFAYIACMYDPNTPLRREFKDLYKRKVYAANICGITPHATSGKYKDYVEEFLIGQNERVNDLIVKFIVSFSSPEYTQLIAHVKIQNDMLDKIVSNKADKNTQVMFDLATDKIKELTNIIYGAGARDEVYEARRALYKQVAYDLSDIKAENVARAISSEGKLPDGWGPYGDYMPDDIHFEGDDIDIARDDEESLP